MSKPIVLLGDLGLDHDGYPPTPVITGSPNVLVDGKPVVRVGDQLAMHSKPFHPPHPRVIASGSSTVMINGMPAAITGGDVACGGVTVGSGSVVVGDSPAAASFSGSTPLPPRQTPASADSNSSTRQVSSADGVVSSSGKQNSGGKVVFGDPPQEIRPESTDAVVPVVEDQHVPALEPGFYIVPESLSRIELLTDLYGDASLKPDRFDVLNPGIGNRVQAGQIIVVGDPEAQECTAEESELIAAAERLNEFLSQLGGSAGNLLVDHFDLMEALASSVNAGLGAGAAMVKKQVDMVHSTMKQMESLHQQTLRKHGNLHHPEFHEQRRKLLKDLDFALGEILRKRMSLKDNPKLKTAFGLSTKRTIQRWRQSGISSLPEFEKHYRELASMSGYLEKGGRAVLALDAGLSVARGAKACVYGSDEECERALFEEPLKFVGSLAGGAMGAKAGLGTCGLLLLFTGIGGVGCSIIAVGAGGFGGGYAGSEIGEFGGEKLRELFVDE